MSFNASKLLIAATEDIGPGELWPVAVLSGAFSAATCAAGAWIALEFSSAGANVALGDWIALHASVGALAGVLVTWLVAAGRRIDGALLEAGSRRAAAARLSAIGAAAVCVCAGFWLRPERDQALAIAAGLGLGVGACALAALRLAASIGRGRTLPRFDPLRVAPLVALLIVPLQDGVDCDSLGDAWRVMLGR